MSILLLLSCAPLALAGSAFCGRVSTGGFDFDLGQLPPIRARDVIHFPAWEYHVSVCLPLPAAATRGCDSALMDGGAIQVTPEGACVSVGARSGGAAAVWVGGFDGAGVGLALTFTGGASSSGCAASTSDGHRTTTLVIVCAETAGEPAVREPQPCVYEVKVRDPAGCPAQCPRDATGAVCGGSARGECAVGADGAGAHCICGAGFLGATCSNARPGVAGAAVPPPPPPPPATAGNPDAQRLQDAGYVTWWAPIGWIFLGAFCARLLQRDAPCRRLLLLPAFGAAAALAFFAAAPALSLPTPLRPLPRAPLNNHLRAAPPPASAHAVPGPAACEAGPGGLSAYARARFEAATEPRCRAWLAPNRTFDTFLSQFGQDAYLYYNYFRCMEGPGSYLDIGAFNPEVMSNTWFLDKCLGWRGICAEGNPVQATPFRTARSCFLVDKPVSIKAGVGTFSSAGAGGSIDGSMGPGSVAPTEIVTLEVALRAAGWMADAAGADDARVRVDFMSLDVEEHELEVLLAIPWARIEISFAAVENNKNRLDVWEFLQERGYWKVATLGVDDVFALFPGTLWAPAWLQEQRRFHNTYRKNTYAPAYLRDVLYKGWEFVYAHVQKHGSFPT